MDAQSFNPLCVSVPTLHNIKNASFTGFWGDKVLLVGICSFKLGSVRGGQVWGLQVACKLQKEKEKQTYSDFILKDISQDI